MGQFWVAQGELGFAIWANSDEKVNSHQWSPAVNRFCLCYSYKDVCFYDSLLILFCFVCACTSQQVLVEDVDEHNNPVNDMIRRIDNFHSQNADRLTPDQRDTLQRLSNDLRNRYDELLRKSRTDLNEAENRLNQIRSEQDEMVCANSPSAKSLGFSAQVPTGLGKRGSLDKNV